MYTALQAAASPLGHSTVSKVDPLRADDETRTRDPHLGKVMRYQLRYIRTALSNIEIMPQIPPSHKEKEAVTPPPFLMLV